jgi:hypothetical protein
MYLTKHHTMKIYGVVEVQLWAFVTLALDGSGWSVQALASLSPGKEPLIPLG